jgi:hypothetical protein
MALTTSLIPSLTLAQAMQWPTFSTKTIIVGVSVVMVISGLTIITVVLAASLRAHRKARSASTPSLPAPRRRADDSVSTVQEAQNLLQLMSEAEELCTRLARQLDEKAANIERLLARAERRLDAIPTIVPYTKPAPPPPHPPSSVVPAPAVSLPVPASSAPAFLSPQPAATRPEIVVRPKPTPVSAAVQAAAAPTPQSTYAPGADPLTLQIYRLADVGLSAAEIARQLGQHTGKVELILALRGT